MGVVARNLYEEYGGDAILGHDPRGRGVNPAAPCKYVVWTSPSSDGGATTLFGMDPRVHELNSARPFPLHAMVALRRVLCEVVGVPEERLFARGFPLGVDCGPVLIPGDVDTAARLIRPLVVLACKWWNSGRKKDSHSRRRPGEDGDGVGVDVDSSSSSSDSSSGPEEGGGSGSGSGSNSGPEEDDGGEKPIRGPTRGPARGPARDSVRKPATAVKRDTPKISMESFVDPIRMCVERYVHEGLFKKDEEALARMPTTKARARASGGGGGGGGGDKDGETGRGSVIELRSHVRRSNRRREAKEALDRVMWGRWPGCEPNASELDEEGSRGWCLMTMLARWMECRVDVRCTMEALFPLVRRKPTVQPYPFQQYVQTLLFPVAGDAHTARSGFVVMPCGSGKTILVVLMGVTIKGAMVIVTSTISNMEQIAAAVRVIVDADVSKREGGVTGSTLVVTQNDVPSASRGGGGRLVAGGAVARDSTQARSYDDIMFVVCTFEWFVGSMMNRADDGEAKVAFRRWVARRVRVLAIDECHRSMTARRTAALMRALRPDKVVVGLTATFVRENPSDSVFGPAIGHVICAGNWKELEALHAISALAILDRPVPWHPLSARVRDELYRDVSPGFHGNQLAGMINVAEFIAILDEARFHRNGKVVIFSDHIAHGRALSELLGVPYLHGKAKTKQRTRIISEFRENPLKRILLLSKIGDDGMDVPTAAVVIQATVIESRSDDAQRAGRALRPKPIRQEGGAQSVLVTIFTGSGGGGSGSGCGGGGGGGGGGGDGADATTGAEASSDELFRHGYLQDHGYSVAVVNSGPPVDSCEKHVLAIWFTVARHIVIKEVDAAVAGLKVLLRKAGKSRWDHLLKCWKDGALNERGASKGRVYGGGRGRGRGRGHGRGGPASTLLSSRAKTGIKRLEALVRILMRPRRENGVPVPMVCAKCHREQQSASFAPPPPDVPDRFACPHTLPRLVPIINRASYAPGAPATPEIFMRLDFPDCWLDFWAPFVNGMPAPVDAVDTDPLPLPPSPSLPPLSRARVDKKKRRRLR